MTVTSEAGGLPPPPAPSGFAPPAPVLDGSSSRGTTRISDAAAARLAEQAASEVDGIAGTAPGGLAALVPGARSTPERRSVDVQARVHEQDVTLDVTVAIDFPRPLRPTLERLVAHLTTRMRDYAGLRLERLDITVSDLQPPGPPAPPRVQ